MSYTHHDLDVHPVPEDKDPIYINEPWLADWLKDNGEGNIHAVTPADNIRIYVPLDICKDDVLNRLDRIVARYEEANEYNEFYFSMDVAKLVAQIEIYDQIWRVRHITKESTHSAEAISLVREFVARLADIPDGCAETFPFELIDELYEEYLK